MVEDSDAEGPDLKFLRECYNIYDIQSRQPLLDVYYNEAVMSPSDNNSLNLLSTNVPLFTQPALLQEEYLVLTMIHQRGSLS